MYALIYSFVISILLLSHSGFAIEVHLSTFDNKVLLEQQPSIEQTFNPSEGSFRVEVDAKQKFQQMDGFGASITDSSAVLMHYLPEEKRNWLMRKLFDRKDGIGISFLRQPLGETDFSFCGRPRYRSPEDPFYMPTCSEDLEATMVFPLLKQAKALNPDLKLMLTPWSAPTSMKTNASVVGGFLRDSAYSEYAQFLMREFERYRANGLPIYALTVQNEPNYSAPYPSMLMKWWDQFNFIYYHLSPALKAAKFDSKILVLDHNWDDIGYARSMFKNEGGKILPHIAGTAFHCYGGKPSAMGELHAEYPDMEIHMTECSGWTENPTDDPLSVNMKWVVENLLIESVRNWSKSILRWNLALDERRGPKNNGCKNCLGLVEIKDSGDVSFLSDYYAIGHLSKFVVPGAYRIESNQTKNSVETVAFQNPDDSKVLLVMNPQATPQVIHVTEGGTRFEYRLPARGVATFKW